MAMARAAAKLIRDNLRHPSGHAVECVIADRLHRRRRRGGRLRGEVRPRRRGGHPHRDPLLVLRLRDHGHGPAHVKAVWGFNGTDRPGAVYLAAVLAAHNQKGLPAFGIYGRDVQDLKDTDDPRRRAEKILRFARAGLAAAWMRGKSYLSIGSVSMGIAGSIVEPDFFQDYLGHAQRVRRHERDARAASTRRSTPTRSSSAPSTGSRRTARRARTTTRPTRSTRASARTRPGPRASRWP